MKATQLLSEIVTKGYNAVINNVFDYSVDKNRRFSTVRIDYAPNIELISIADSHQCLWVAQTLAEMVNGNTQVSVIYYAMPKNMIDFDFDEK